MSTLQRDAHRALHDSHQQVTKAARELHKQWRTLWPTPPIPRGKYTFITKSLKIGFHKRSFKHDIAHGLVYFCVTGNPSLRKELNKQKVKAALEISSSQFLQKLRVQCNSPRLVVRACARLDAYASWLDSRRWGICRAAENVLVHQEKYLQKLQCRTGMLELSEDF